jgi:hypothetical protein
MDRVSTQSPSKQATNLSGKQSVNDRMAMQVSQEFTVMSITYIPPPQKKAIIKIPLELLCFYKRIVAYFF